MPESTAPSTIRGIDPYAPGGLEQLLDFHRAFWGDAVMEEGEGAEGDDPADQDDLTEDDDEDQDDSEEPEDDGESELGDAGKRALDRMKAKYKAERKRRRELESQRTEKKESGSDDEESDPEKIREQARTEAETEATKRVKRAEIKAAIANKVVDPALAVSLIDVDDIDLDDDGNPDEDGIADAVDDLLKKKPYLAAQSGKGQSFDSARGKNRKPKKVTREQLKTMTPEQVSKAYKEGRIEGA